MHANLTILVCFVVVTAVCAGVSWVGWKRYIIDADQRRYEEGRRRCEEGMQMECPVVNGDVSDKGGKVAQEEVSGAAVTEQIKEVSKEGPRGTLKDEVKGKSKEKLQENLKGGQGSSEEEAAQSPPSAFGALVDTQPAESAEPVAVSSESGTEK